MVLIVVFSKFIVTTTTAIVSFKVMSRALLIYGKELKLNTNFKIFLDYAISIFTIP